MLCTYVHLMNDRQTRPDPFLSLSLGVISRHRSPIIVGRGSLRTAGGRVLCSGTPCVLLPLSPGEQAVLPREVPAQELRLQRYTVTETVHHLTGLQAKGRYCTYQACSITTGCLEQNPLQAQECSQLPVPNSQDKESTPNLLPHIS